MLRRRFEMCGKTPRSPVAPGGLPRRRLHGLLLLSGLALLQPAAADSGPPEPDPQPVRYMVVVTGGELLAGAFPDGHTYFLTKTLHPLGLQCAGSMTVGDREADIQEALRFATGKASLVIVTGGLGPTDNDVTRRAITDFTGIALREHPDVLKEMERRFHASPGQLRSNLRRQAQTPTQGGYLKNARGTAVGLVFELAHYVIVALPGPPHELQPMVRDELIPYLSRRFGTRPPGCSITLRFVGIGQSRIDQTLKDHALSPSDMTLSSQFEGSRVDFSFALPDDTPENRARLDRLKQAILRHLGEYVYAEGEMSLEQRVVQLLARRGATLALAEAGTAGGLTAGLDEAEGADRVLSGAFVAPTEAKLQKLLRIPEDAWTRSASGAERARLLAAAAADLTSSQWAIAVGAPRRDSRGEDGVDVVFRMPDGRLASRRMELRGGESGRSRLITRLLDQLRRELR